MYSEAETKNTGQKIHVLVKFQTGGQEESRMFSKEFHRC